MIDCETDPFGSLDDKGRLIIPQPFVWGFYDGERFEHFSNAAELVEFLKPQRLMIYAHNGGKFDYHYMLTFIEPYSDVTIINGRLSRFMIGNCEFRDSYNILPIPLAQYKKDEMDYSKMDKKVRHLHMPEIMRYLRNDCVYLHELVSQFRAQYGPGLTLAGSAMRFWKTLTGENSPQTDGAFYAAVSPFYYGGRVECFKQGIVEYPFSVLDINSAYPYAMLRDHPFSESFHEVDCTSKDAIRGDSLYTVHGIAKGCFPFRERHKLIFPNDDKARTYYVTGWELEAGLATKTFAFASRMVRRCDFGKTINFRLYIEHFYRLKSSAPKESSEYLFAKLFMNSLYGKFGANPENYANSGIVPIDVAEHFTDPTKADAAMDANECALDIGKHKVPWNDGTDGDPAGFYWKPAGTLGPWALLQGDLADAEKHYYNLATAASITGFVRAFLFRHIHAIRAAGGEPLYCDTDSIAFAGPGIGGFSIGKALGEWSDEGAFTRGAIAGKKLYAFQYATPKKGKDGKPLTHKIASKGVRLCADEIFRVAGGSEVQAESQVPTFSVHAAAKFQKRKIRATAGR